MQANQQSCIWTQANQDLAITGKIDTAKILLGENSH